ncbi:hypothetical protein HZB97_00300 [Candidatus Gottesmanbacteria bacterium]|nr:hypothetical protein [Candidatus Gottesmanbacteria bacterium]MBI5465212.1 hypothetical protein [Candidatus Gottesmanbacteria bacterium]
MRRGILTIALTFSFLIFFNSVALGKTPTPAPTPGVIKVDYVLPYPGILPDHVLYPVKMLRDRILDFFIREPIKKTEFLILMADKRLGAGKTLIDYGKISLGEITVSKGEKYLERAIGKVSEAQRLGKNVSGVLDKLEKSTKKHLEVLEEVLEKAPESAKPGLMNALENAQKGYQKVRELKGTK